MNNIQLCLLTREGGGVGGRKKQMSEMEIFWWIQTLLDLRNSYIPEDPTQIEINYTYGQLYKKKTPWP